MIDAILRNDRAAILDILRCATLYFVIVAVIIAAFQRGWMTIELFVVMTTLAISSYDKALDRTFRRHRIGSEFEQDTCPPRAD